MDPADSASATSCPAAAPRAHRAMDPADSASATSSPAAAPAPTAPWIRRIRRRRPPPQRPHPRPPRHGSRGFDVVDLLPSGRTRAHRAMDLADLASATSTLAAAPARHRAMNLTDPASATSSPAAPPAHHRHGSSGGHSGSRRGMFSSSSS
jgi:hypothetical protein